MADKATLNLSVNVFMYRVGTLDFVSSLANGLRGDVGDFLHDDGLHGFEVRVPESWKRGAIDVEMKGADGKLLGGGKFTLNCVADTPPVIPPVIPPMPPLGYPYLGTGLLIVDNKIVADGSVILMWGNPNITPCQPKTVGLDAIALYLYVCVPDGSPDKGKWKKLKLIE